MSTQVRDLAAKIAADAKDDRLDDAAFRRRARRAAAKLQQLLEEEAPLAPRGGRAAVPASRKSTPAQSRYVFVAVPNGTGGMTSVSIVNSVFDELAESLGGRNQVTALARKLALGHKPDSGVSRSAYVLKRLQQRAASAASASTARSSTERRGASNKR